MAEEKTTAESFDDMPLDEFEAALLEDFEHSGPPPLFIKGGVLYGEKEAAEWLLAHPDYIEPDHTIPDGE